MALCCHTKNMTAVVFKVESASTVIIFLGQQNAIVFNLLDFIVTVQTFRLLSLILLRFAAGLYMHRG
jgi:hypothetical protein